LQVQINTITVIAASAGNQWVFAVYGFSSHLLDARFHGHDGGRGDMRALKSALDKTGQKLGSFLHFFLMSMNLKGF
jgi:hypothetical protein